MLTVLGTVEQAIMRWTLRAAMVLLVLAAGIAFYQVVTRFLFEEPSTWSEVAARSLTIWMVYLGVAAAFRTGALLAVDFLYSRLTGTARLVLTAVIFGLSLGVLLVMVGAGIDMVMRARFQMLAGVENPITGGGISIAWVYAAVPTGAALAIVGLLARTAEQVRGILAERTGTAASAPHETYEV